MAIPPGLSNSFVEHSNHSLLKTNHCLCRSEKTIGLQTKPLLCYNGLVLVVALNEKIQSLQSEKSVLILTYMSMKVVTRKLLCCVPNGRGEVVE